MRITGYTFGEITIDGKNYSRDVIISGNTVYPNWRREKGHKVKQADLETVLTAHTVRIFIGTGYSGMVHAGHSLESYCSEHGIELKLMRTQKAVERFNQIGPSDDTIWALHLTC